MGELGRKFRQHMLVRGYSEATRESYEQAVVALVRAYGGTSPDQLSCDQVQAFLADLIGKKKRAWSTVNVYVSAFRCFYQDVLGRKQNQFSLPRRSRPSAPRSAWTLRHRPRKARPRPSASCASPASTSRSARSARWAACSVLANCRDLGTVPHERERRYPPCAPITRPDEPRGRSCARARKNRPVLGAPRPIRMRSDPRFTRLRAQVRPPAPAYRTRQDRAGHSNPIARHPTPAAPFNNILSPMRQETACLDSGTVLHLPHE